MFMSGRRVFVSAPTGATLALWLAVAGVSFGFATAPALAEESEATEATVAEPGQEPEAPAFAEGEAPDASDPEAESASSSPDRPRSRVVRPDPSDLDDALWDSSPQRQDASGTPGTGEVMECMAGCADAHKSPVLAHSGNAAKSIPEPHAPATSDIVCVAGC